MYTRKSPARAALGLTTLLLLAGCSTETPGKTDPATPQPVPSTSSQSTVPGDPRKAPPVKNPLDATKFIADPCLSLSQTQLTGFNVQGVGERNDGSGAVACGWRFGTNANTRVDVAYSPKITEGLSRLYAQNAANFFEKGFFQPTDEIPGYPAVYSDPMDNRSTGGCGLDVGITDQLFFTVLIQGRAGKDPCKRALNVAKAVVETISSGQ